MKQLFSKFIRIVLVVYVFVFAYLWWKPASEHLTQPLSVRHVPESSVHFYADTTFFDKSGKRVTSQTIWDHILNMIGHAEHAIVLDMFLFNDYQGKSPEMTRPLAKELTDALVARADSADHVAIALITDPINTVYGGVVSSNIERLTGAGVLVVTTDLTRLRDSNLFWGAFWRPFISWWGNSETHGWLPHPFQYGGTKVPLRSWLALFNFKANHRKIIIADEPGKRGEGQKMLTLVTSSNPHDGSSAHGNVALQVDDHIWQDALTAETLVAKISGSSFPSWNIGTINDASGTLRVGLVNDGRIKEKALGFLAEAGSDTVLDIAMFYLSDRDIVDALVAASNRGAKIRLILDPNKDAFGFTKNGIPNRPVAKELIAKTVAGIDIRWCDTHGEQCHAKLMVGRNATTTFLMLGSANFTRRNLDDFNLESDIFVEHSRPFTAWTDAERYFENLWTNTGGTFTTDYEKYQDRTLWKSSLYRLMERTGLSSF